MRTLILLSIAAIGLTACGGNETQAKLNSACENMAKMAGETPPKGACDCMSSTLVENLSDEDAKAVANAFSAMEKPEDAMMQMIPLLANRKIMKALGEVEKKCDIK